jgi:hypothetical protein
MTAADHGGWLRHQRSWILGRSYSLLTGIDEVGVFPPALGNGPQPPSIPSASIEASRHAINVIGDERRNSTTRFTIEAVFQFSAAAI